MTIVIEGQMDIQFFSKDKAGKLIKDGAKLTLNAGQVSTHISIYAFLHFSIITYSCECMIYNIAYPYDP